MIVLRAGCIFFDILAPYRWTEMRALALVVCSMFLLFAQEPLPEGGYRVGNGVTAPRLIKKVQPQFSHEARIAHLVGTVVLEVTIGTDGRARDFKVLRSLGFGLDESAMAAVGSWEFGPGLKDGQPVNVRATIEENFRRLGLPDGASRPMIEKVAAPSIADDAATPNVRLTLDIDEKGVPVNIPIEEASNEGFSRAVAAALSKWRFTPASRGGIPISVSCTMDFVRGN
jgi:TonB family protein